MAPPSADPIVDNSRSNGIVPENISSIKNNAAPISETIMSEAKAKLGIEHTAPWVLNKTPYETPNLSFVDRFIDDTRQLRVAVIGGGIGGILSGILLPAKVPGVQLTIYEKNNDFGGTWLENVYPGVRCDIPSHVYQSTFSPKIDWTDQFSPGAEIRDYWQSVARKYDVYRFAKFHHQVQDAQWDADSGKWSLKIQDTSTERAFHEDFDVVITAVGRFNAWKLPDYPGINEYEGILRHASNYDSSFDPQGKRVAVIGNGASGIQVVTNLQKVVGRLDHYARNRTWIASSWAGDAISLGAQPIPQDSKEAFQDPDEYLKFRKQMEDKYWRKFGTFFRNSAENEDLRERFTNMMRERLAKKPEILQDIVPDFSPNCRRLTPGPGYLEAITEDNVDYIRTPIKRFTKTGIETVDGVQRDVYAIFCATGANTDMVPRFNIRALGKNLGDLWKQDGPYGFPFSYLGVSTPGFPNLFFLNGPHGTSSSGTVPHNIESQVTYFAKVLRKMSREGIKSIDASAKATNDFIEYSDAFFARTTLSDNCSSWYNGGRPGARIHGIWPGSAVHLTMARREPRWEDFEYEYLSETGNRFLWYFGNGWTRREEDPNVDLTPYLKRPEEIDLRDVHESWWSIP